ncbi:MAG: hypothetical protein MZV64_47365 [Ignavibacteriales bacterium]|nr:hypothetical protein [Ignavibacteriales bacterium]
MATGVYDISSANYHGKSFINSTNKFQDCQQCHASDYSGGITEVSCYSSGCHVSPSINVHEEGILDQQSSAFHGKFIADNAKHDWLALVVTEKVIKVVLFRLLAQIVMHLSLCAC